MIKDKNLPRLRWNTGTITAVRTSDDGLVRSATVRPHRRKDKTTTEKERDRPIHDLILLREASIVVSSLSKPVGIDALSLDVNEEDVVQAGQRWIGEEKNEETERENADFDYTKCPGCGSNLDSSSGLPWCYSLHRMILQAHRGTFPKRVSSPKTFSF